MTDPIPDFPGFVSSLLAKGYKRNPCRDNCPDRDTEHEHLRTPEGTDGIVWADGKVSEYDLTQPARLIYPAPPRRARDMVRTATGPGCYQTPGGMAVHVKPGCRC